MIKVSNIVKKFDDFVALDNISFEIPKGCIFGMVGSNGAGKSTLLRLINGIYSANSGKITLDDEPVYENTRVKQKMVYVADELFYLGNACMDRLAQTYASVYPTFSMEKYEELKNVFGLDGKKNMNAFSKGMKRQGITILALACQTEYVFFDETFDGLDPVIRNLVKSIICKDILERNATAVITSHSLRELEDTCDQLAFLHKGGLVLQSNIGELKTNLYKIQAAFRGDYDRKLIDDIVSEKKDEIKVMHFAKHGSVCEIIIKGEKDFVLNKMREHEPVILEVLPLTLEEVFTYEMELLGYMFDEMIE